MIKKADLEKLTIDELQDLRDDLAEDLASIGGQIDAAKWEAQATRVYADHEWFRKAAFAKRAKGAEHQRVLTEIARRKQQDRKKNANSLGEAFIDVARRRLSAEVFADLMDEAINIHSEAI